MRVLQAISHLPKAQLFGLIILAIAVVGAGASMIVRATLLNAPERPPMKVMLLLPEAGLDAKAGEQLRLGAELAATHYSQSRSGSKQPVAVETVRVAAAAVPDAMARFDAAEDVIAVINAVPQDAALNGLQVPRIAVDSRFVGVADDPWRFAAVPDELGEVRFLANYVHNVIRERTVAIVHTDDERGRAVSEAFDQTFRRFGTKILFDYGYPADAAGRDARFDEVVGEIRDKKIPGFVFAHGDPEAAASLTVKLRRAGVRNPVIGLSPLAAEAYVRAVETLVAGNGATSTFANGLIVTTPLLFDTAPMAAQGFFTQFSSSVGRAPDWTAATGYDLVRRIARAMRSAIADDEAPPRAVLREAVRDGLEKGTDDRDGLFGAKLFGPKHRSRVPLQIGVYNGTDVISALTQLQPIGEGVETDYLEELKRGRILDVNDRFMYKTNVVYSGIELRAVTEPDLEKSTAKLEFDVWFRYRGNFAPEDVVFDNAIEPITLTEPARLREVDGMTYKAYRVSGRFRINFSQSERPFGSQTVGVALHHRVLSDNNLRYVRDVLGMRRVGAPTLVDTLRVDGAIAQLENWKISRAWFSQEVRAVSSVGDPDYVGYGKPPPNFSGLELGVMIAPDRFDIREYIGLQTLIYAGIFALLVIGFANIMDMREMGMFWRNQTLIMRLAAWPVFLVAGGSVTLDYTIQNYSEYYAKLVLTGWDSLWWLVAARMLVKVLDQFIIIPVEIRSQRQFPNLMKYFIHFSIYMLGVFAVVAFVFNQTLTSLLATSGLLTFIVGLAVQGNISNLFSGLVINLERPLRVGDWVTFDDAEEGKIIDITWRSIRYETRSGQTISIPNGKASEAAIRNYTAKPVNRLSFTLNLDPGADPRRVCAVLLQGLQETPGVVQEPPPFTRYRGTVDGHNDWGGQYELQYWITDYGGRERIENEAWSNVWARLEAADLVPPLRSSHGYNRAARKMAGE